MLKQKAIQDKKGRSFVEENAQVFGAWVAALPFEVPFDLEELKANPISPIGEVGEDEEIIGYLTEEERFAWTLAERFNEASERARVDFNFARSDAQREDAGRQFHLNVEKAEVVRVLFWAIVRENNDLWTANHLALRGGYKIVKSEDAGLGSLVEAILPHPRHRH